MSRFGDRDYSTCGPGCGCDDDLEDLEESGSISLPDNMESDCGDND